MSHRILSLAVAALVSCVVTVVSGEERISYPSSGPLGALTYGLDVADSTEGEVAVWFVGGSGVRISGVRPEDGSRLVAGARENRAPQIVSAGDAVDVYWADGGTLFTRRYDAATLVGSEPRVIATGVDHPSVARNGSVTAVMVEPYPVGATFTGSILLLLDENGDETRRTPVWESDYPFGSRHATVAPHGDGFVSSQRTAEGIFVRRLSIEGALLDAAPIRAGDATNAWAFAAAGELAWIVTRADGAPYPLHLFAIDRTGSVVVSKTVPTPATTSRTNGLAIAARTDGLVVLAGLDDDVWRFRFATDGTELEPPRSIVETPGRQEARGISSGASELVFWSESDQADILVQRDDSEAWVLTVGGSSASGLSVAASDEAFLVAWRDHLGTAHTYRYALLDSSGAPRGEPVAFDSGNGFNGDPQVAWSGTEFGILWHANQRTQLLLLAPDGTPHGPPSVLGAVPSKTHLAGGHGRLVALWTSGLSIVASELGAAGTGEPVALTTPIPPPPHAGSSDGSPILLTTTDGFELVYENTFYFDCVGIPCPTETSVYAVASSPELEPDIASRTLVAPVASLAAAAISEGVLGVLASRLFDLELVTVPLGTGASATHTLWQRTGWQPVLGESEIAAHPSGFVAALHGEIAPTGWTSFFELGTDGNERGLRVLSGKLAYLRLASSGPSHVALYSRSNSDGVGSSVYSVRWEDAPPGPAAPSTPTRVIARRLAHPFVELTWEYEGPPLLAFTISPGPFENVTIVPPESRSIIFVPTRPTFRVVAINEAGSATSNVVQPKLERTRGVRR